MAIIYIAASVGMEKQFHICTSTYGLTLLFRELVNTQTNNLNINKTGKNIVMLGSLGLGISKQQQECGEPMD